VLNIFVVIQAMLDVESDPVRKLLEKLDPISIRKRSAIKLARRLLKESQRDCSGMGGLSAIISLFECLPRESSAPEDPAG
jgi:hypothetical protein